MALVHIQTSPPLHADKVSWLVKALFYLIMGVSDYISEVCFHNFYSGKTNKSVLGHLESWNNSQSHSQGTRAFSSVHSLSHVWLFSTPWTAAHQASLSVTNTQSLLKLKSIESMMPSNHLILCHPLLLLPSIFPSIRVFSNESVLFELTKFML